METYITVKNISLFSKPANTVKPVDKMSLVDLYKLIISDKYKGVTEELRALENPKLKKDFKESSFDFFTGSGIFPYREDGALKYHSEYIVIDLDHLGDALRETMTKLITDDKLYVLLMFVSPSGDGLKVVYGIDLSEGGHRKWFKAIRNYLRETYNLEADPSGINESRTCFLAHDPECYACKEILENV